MPAPSTVRWPRRLAAVVVAVVVLAAVFLVVARQLTADTASDSAQPQPGSTPVASSVARPSVLPSSSGLPRPTRPAGPVIAVTSQGAVPDDGKDDSVAINKALGAGQTVQFSKGQYDIRAESVKPRSGQWLEFDDGAVLAAAPYVPSHGGSPVDNGIEDAHNRAALEIVNVHDVVIENVGVYGSRDKQPTGQLMGINVLGDAQRITFLGGRIRQVSGDGRGRTMGDGLYIGTTDTLRRENPAVPQDVRVDGLVVEDSDRQGVAAVEVRRLSITGSTFRHNRAAGVDVEPNFAKGINEDTVIRDSTFDDNGLGVNVSDFAKRTKILHNSLTITGDDPRADNISSLGQRTEIRGNRIRRGNHCVFVAGLAGQDGFGVGGAIGSVVADNDMAGCTIGVRVSARDVQVVRNRIANMAEQGLILDGSLPTERARGSTVSANTFTDCSRPGIEYSTAILAADAVSAKITGNTVVDRRGAQAAAYGIQLNGVEQERATHVVSGNRVRGTTMGAGAYTPGGRTFS